MGRSPWPASPRIPKGRKCVRELALANRAEEEVALTAGGQEGGPGSPRRGAAGGEAALSAGGRVQRRDARPRAHPQPLPHSVAPRGGPPGPSHSSPSGDARPGVKLVPQPLRGRAGRRAIVSGGRAHVRRLVPARPPRPTIADPAHHRVPPAPPRVLSSAPSQLGPETENSVLLKGTGPGWESLGTGYIFILGGAPAREGGQRVLYGAQNGSAPRNWEQRNSWGWEVRESSLCRTGRRPEGDGL